MKTLIKLTVILLVFTGCATVDLSVNKNFDFSQVKKVGVLTFDTTRNNKYEMYGRAAADEFSLRLLASGFSVVERSQIEKVVSELKLAQSGAIDPEQAKEVGKMAGVDAVVIGSLTPALRGGKQIVRERRVVNRRGRVRRVQERQRVGRRVRGVNMTAKMVHVETGEILWVGTANKEDADVQFAIKLATRAITRRLNKELD